MKRLVHRPPTPGGGACRPRGAEYLSVLGEPAARAAAPARYRAAGALTAVEVGPVVTDQDPEAVTRWLLSHLGRQR